MGTETSATTIVSRAARFLDLPPAWRETWPLDRRVALLVIGDALAFLLFAAIGRRSHQEAAGVGALGQIAWTALPFALGWFAVSPLLGAFRRVPASGGRRKGSSEVEAKALLAALAQTELAWLAAWPAALLLRWALSADHQIPLSFALVILIANALLLGSWRTGFALAQQLFWRPAGK
jgi:hypothetical protein